MKVKSYFYYVAFIYCFLMPGLSYGFGDSGDGGCCGALDDSMIAKIASTYGVDGLTAIEMRNRLGKETFKDLRMLESNKSNACEAYRACNVIPEGLFRVLLGDVIDEHKEIAQAAKRKQAFVFTAIAAVVAMLGLLLGLFNAWQTHRRQGNPPEK